MLITTTSFAFSQNNLTELENQFQDEQIKKSAGITPESPFYFIDTFFDQFSDPIKVKEEKAAEIKKLLEEEKYDIAQKAYEKYEEYAQKTGEKLTPEKKEQTVKSSFAIKNSLKEFEEEVDFIKEIEKEENKIIEEISTADKIKQLCEQLSTEDPKEYEKLCKVDEGSPEWQKKLNDDLTEKQKQEAETLFKVISQCIQTNGEKCDCDKIEINSFREECKIASKLSVECENGNEESCEKLDERPSPEELLPDYLKDVIEKLEKQFGFDDEENYLPDECQEEGITDELECEILIFKIYAPSECKDGLENGEIKFTTQEETNEECGKYLEKLYLAEECKDKGIEDWKECDILLFEMYSPKECLEAGLTGENEDDNKKCDEIMKELYEEEAKESEKEQKELMKKLEEETQKTIEEEFEIAKKDCDEFGGEFKVEDDGTYYCDNSFVKEENKTGY